MNETVSDLTKTECDHCGNQIRLVRIEAKVGNATKVFCCEGCETVYSIINSLGGSYYYNLKGNTKLDPVRIEDSDADVENELVYEKFVRKSGEFSEVSVQITNIHCSACVWINEKVLNEEEGILSAQINFASGRARIRFDRSKIKISRILSLIRAIGYKPVLFSPTEGTLEKTKQLKTLLLRIGVAGFCFGNIMILSVALYSGYFTGIDLDIKRLFHYASWVFATPAYLYSGYPFMSGFLTSIRRRTLSMDFLLFLGISMAYFYSVYVTLTDIGEVYFDSVAMIYFFILIGKYFEEKARVFASDKLESILCKLPETSVRVTESGEETIPSSEIKIGDTIRVAPGKRIPVDAILVSEQTYVDESFLTGESLPIRKKKGDSILAGSLTMDNPALIVAGSDYHASTLSSLKLRLEEALHLKPKLQILTERIASYFITVVFGLAFLCFFVWYYVSGGNLEQSLVTTISVLIVACPCALGISVPTALVTNHILNADKGVLLKNPSVVEALAKADTIFLDKTGTLTEGKFLVRQVSVKEEHLPLVYRIEKEVNHPLAKSLVKYLQPFSSVTKRAESIVLSHLENIPGRGVKAEIEVDSKKLLVLIGNKTLLETEKIPMENLPEGEGSLILLAVNGMYLGSFLLADEIRPGARSFVSLLKHFVPNISILSGDRFAAVKFIADSLGIEKYVSDLSPEDKRNIISSAQNSGNVVIMVGDGINDSLSLAQANVSISHTEAEDLSLEKSDVVLTSGNLNGLVHSLLSAKKTREVILQNIIISFCYNSIMLPLAMFGLMLPVICAVFMACSSLTVLLNSLSIRIRIPQWKPST
ncbi:heavy metal translocating P-type ATPase [Leptospira montravelensis]|uniref:Heavy metal translocating P-type ATPase n=1 Tax=Leptospira montravelensis TaxID=2484961 RepID=A0ABY2LVB6_9LEPT|nr:heavy metal translocating P-type ATPase [Leptospira montravelensis]TGK86591.1 heavy metal translocating P-type ATPase [Leptospira montravelensis]TGL02847.1 heavy metal translocating P-type ATPase [Leptospira montravelensis]